MRAKCISIAALTMVVAIVTTSGASDASVNDQEGADEPPSTVPVLDSEYEPGPPFEPPLPTDSDQPTEEQIRIAVDRALNDPEVTAKRKEFGLKTDAAAISAAVTDTMMRRANSVYLGIPMDDSEVDAYLKWQGYLRGLQPYQEFAEKHSGDFAGYESNRDIDDPYFYVQITDGTPSSLLQAAESLLPNDLPYSVEVVRFSTADVFEAAEAAQGAIRSGADSDLTRSADSVNLVLLDVAVSTSSQEVELTAEFDRSGRTNDELTRQLREQLGADGNVGFQIVQSGPEIPTIGRLESPGQAKGGLRISASDGACTSSSSIGATTGLFNVTAGHCYNDNGPGSMTHVGINYGTVAAGGYQDVQGSLSVRALDYAIAGVSTGGMVSEYVMEVSDTTGNSSYHNLVGVNSATETTSTIVCYGGASSNRTRIYQVLPYRTLCGWVTQSNSGSGRVKASINVCLGDSGALVYAYNQAYGIVSRSEIPIAGTDGTCSSVVMYARMAAQLTNIGGSASVVTRSFGNPKFSHSGQCVDAAYGSTLNGTAVTQYPCHGLIPQRWRLVPVNGSSSDVYYLIRDDGPYCLDATGTGAGSAVQQWECHYGTNQQWTLRRATGNLFSLSPRSSVTLCLQVAGGSVTSGALIQLGTCNGSSSQNVSI